MKYRTQLLYANTRGAQNNHSQQTEKLAMNESNSAEGGNGQPQQELQPWHLQPQQQQYPPSQWKFQQQQWQQQQQQIPSHRTIDPDFKKLLQRCLNIEGDNKLFITLSNEGINDWGRFQVALPHHFEQLNTIHSIDRDALVNLRRLMDYKNSRDEDGGYDMTNYNFKELDKFVRESYRNNGSNDSSPGREVTTTTIEYETTHFDAIDERILKSEDKPGTLQTGWRRENDKYLPIPLFLREHLSRFKESLDAFMSHSRLRNMYVSGPSGLGKTTYVLLYFTIYAATNKKKGLIVQYSEKESNEIMILEGQHIRRVTSSTADDEIHKLVENIVKYEGKNSFDFYVFDGVLQNKIHCQNIRSSIESFMKTESKYIAITPLEFDIKGSDCMFGYRGIGTRHHAWSWEKEDYVKAMNAGLLNIDERKKIFCLKSELQQDNENDMDWRSLFERKYFYAGGSARYMFDCSIDELISTERPSVFGTLCEKMTQEDWTSFSDLTLAPRSTPPCVSTVMQLLGKGMWDERWVMVPVSEYFLHLAHRKLKSRLTESVRRVSSHPVVKRWAFKLEQLDIVEQMMSEDPKILVSEDRALVLPISSRETTTYNGSSIGKTTGNFFTIWCSSWNQGCFDIAFYVNQHLITMNFTTEDSHSLKIDPIRDLKDALDSSGKAVSKLTHIAVVEDEKRCKSFTFDNPEGDVKPVDTVLFSLETACSQKLNTKVARKHQDHSARYGNPLGVIAVYPRERKSSRKRKQPERLDPSWELLSAP